MCTFGRLKCPPWKAPGIALLWASLFCFLLHSLAAGTLEVSIIPAQEGSTVDLSAEGRADWVHWGHDPANLLNRKAGVAAQISDLTLLGFNLPERDQFERVGCSWVGGTPTTATTNTTTSIFITGIENGFQMQAPAGTLLKRLRIHASAYASQGRFEAWLSDNSAVAYSDGSLFSLTDKTNAVYEIQYAAASSNQTLYIRFKVEDQFDPEFGNVSIQAATLLELGTNQPPFISIVNPVHGGSWSTRQALPIRLNTGDADGYVQKVEFFANGVKIGESIGAPFDFLWDAPSPGEQNLCAVATDDQGARSRSATVTISVHTGNGILQVLSTPAPLAVNLTAEGRTDWAHWGLQTEMSFNHKAGVVGQIGNYEVIGPEFVYNFFDNPTAYTWTDGTPTVQARDTPSGVYTVGLNNGFQVKIPADTILKTAKLHVGAYGARGRLVATLSDYSAPPQTDVSINNPSSGPGGVYEIQFRANEPGETLTLTYTVAEMHDQSFGNVTLQAATLMSENEPPFVSIVSPPAGSSSLMGTPVSVSAQAGDLDGSVSRVDFLIDGLLAGSFTQGPYNLTLSNLALGTHTFTARATDNKGATRVSLASQLHVIRGGGYLQGSFGSPPAQVNLTAEGKLDWAHWGLDNRRSYNHKSGVQAELSDFSSVGTSFIRQYSDNYSGFSWSDGIPARNAAETHTGFFVFGAGKGFELNVPASPTLKQVRIYCGVYSAKGRFEARLGDFSAAPYVHDGLQRVLANGYGVYSVVFAAASQNQTLRIRWVADEVYDPLYGNVTWQAATLAKAPKAPRLTALGVGSNAPIRFVFPTELSFNYTVEYSDEMLFRPWHALTNFSGNGFDTMISDPTGPAKGRAYRVRVE